MSAKLIITRSKSLLEVNLALWGWFWLIRGNDRGALPVTSALRIFAETNRRNWRVNIGAQRHLGSPVERQ